MGHGFLDGWGGILINAAMRNELLGYLAIPVIAAGGVSVWKMFHPDRGLPGFDSLRWSKAEKGADYSEEDVANFEADEALEADEDVDSSYADR